MQITAGATLAMCPCAIEALQLPPYGETEELQKLHQTACDQRAKACELFCALWQAGCCLIEWYFFAVFT